MGKTEQIVSALCAGMTAREVSEYVGTSIPNVYATARRKGVKLPDGNAKRRKPKKEKGKPTVRLTEEQVAERFTKWNLEYVSGYVNRASLCVVKCMKCGSTFVRSLDSQERPKTEGKSPCKQCRHNETVERVEKQKKTRQAEREREQKRRKELLNYKGVQMQLDMYVCSDCGGVFSGNDKKKRCERCQRIIDSKRYHTKDVKRRAKIEIGDTSISLDDLVKREKGVCWICGQTVDMHDCYWKGKSFVAGNNYPSIDHVIPLAKGGRHEWQNVRLAHRVCNSRKGAKLISTPGGAFIKAKVG